jgi:hypothetical protein
VSVTVGIEKQEFDIKTRTAVDLLMLLFMDYRKVVKTNLLIIKKDFKVPVFIDAARCISG